MRIWSINPKYLDAKGLVAVWRESLLALAVLRGETKGYIHHPQLIRFRSLENPVYGMAQYLTGVFEESMRRSYHFNGNKIPESTSSEMRIPVTEGQIEHIDVVLVVQCDVGDRGSGDPDGLHPSDRCHPPRSPHLHLDTRDTREPLGRLELECDRPSGVMSCVPQNLTNRNFVDLGHDSVNVVVHGSASGLLRFQERCDVRKAADVPFGVRAPDSVVPLHL